MRPARTTVRARALAAADLGRMRRHIAVVVAQGIMPSAAAASGRTVNTYNAIMLDLGTADDPIWRSRQVAAGISWDGLLQKIKRALEQL